MKRRLVGRDNVGMTCSYSSIMFHSQFFSFNGWYRVCITKQLKKPFVSEHNGNRLFLRSALVQCVPVDSDITTHRMSLGKTLKHEIWTFSSVLSIWTNIDSCDMLSFLSQCHVCPRWRRPAQGGHGSKWLVSSTEGRHTDSLMGNTS